MCIHRISSMYDCIKKDKYLDHELLLNPLSVFSNTWYSHIIPGFQKLKVLSMWSWTLKYPLAFLSPLHFIHDNYGTKPLNYFHTGSFREVEGRTGNETRLSLLHQPKHTLPTSRVLGNEGTCAFQHSSLKEAVNDSPFPCASHYELSGKDVPPNDNLSTNT